MHLLRAGVPLLLLTVSFVGAVASLPSLGASGGGATVVEVKWGPFHIEGGQQHGHGDGENLFRFGIEKPCESCFITKIVPNLTHPDGSTANFSTMAMLHHVVLAQSGAPDATCGGTPLGSLGSRIFASGNERTVMEFPPGYGLPVTSDGSWTLVTHIMNMHTEERQFYLDFDFTIEPDSADLAPVTPVWLDVDNCGDSEFMAPAGPSDTHWDWTSTIEGNIVGMAGHVHDHGIAVSAENVTRDAGICDSLAGFAEGSTAAPAGHSPGLHFAFSHELPGDPAYMGHIEEMSRCHEPRMIRTGDVIRLHTLYNLPEMRHDVMGIMIAYVYETDEAVRVKGDLDCNGVIGVDDALLGLRRLSNPGGAQTCSTLDMDCDQTGGAEDTAFILAHVARVEREMPAGCFPPGSALPPLG